MTEREVLVIRGHLDRAGRFTPRGCRSTPHVRQWPVVEDSDLVVELLNRDDQVMHREVASVRADVDCTPGAAQSFHVDAYIELREDAAAVQLRRDDLVLWRQDIGEPANLEVALGRRSRERAILRLKFSRPRDGANLLVVYQWGEGRFEPVYVGAPTEQLAVALTELPGGPACRFAVTYSDGLRSASGVTEPFEIKTRGPRVSIVRPSADASVIADTPVIFEGAVLDRERPAGPRPDENVTWLVDDVRIGAGLITSVDGLAAGEHVVEMIYTGEPGASDRVVITALRSRTPTADTWEDWNPLV